MRLLTYFNMVKTVKAVYILLLLQHNFIKKKLY